MRIVVLSLLVFVNVNLCGMLQRALRQLTRPTEKQQGVLSEQDRVRHGIMHACSTIEDCLTALEQQQATIAHQEHERFLEEDWEIIDDHVDWSIVLQRHDGGPSAHYIAPEKRISWYLVTQELCRDVQAEPLAAIASAIHQLREQVIFAAQRYDDRYVESVYETYRKNFAMIPGGFDWRYAYEYLGWFSVERYKIPHAAVLQKLDYYKRCDADCSRAFLHRQLGYIFATPDAKQQYDAALAGPVVLAKRKLQGDSDFIHKTLSENILAYHERVNSLKAVAHEQVQKLLAQSVQE